MLRLAGVRRQPSPARFTTLRPRAIRLNGGPIGTAPRTVSRFADIERRKGRLDPIQARVEFFHIHSKP